MEVWALVAPFPPSTPRLEKPNMRKRTNGNGLLVAVELGGAWPVCVAALDRTLAGRRVIAQAEGESPLDFAERVSAGLEQLFGRGVRLSSLVLACNERVDVAANCARQSLSRVALGTMAKHGSGRVCLAAAPRSSGRLRHALADLARELSLEWTQAGLEASVEFGEDVRPPGDSALPSLTARVA